MPVLPPSIGTLLARPRAAMPPAPDVPRAPALTPEAATDRLVRQPWFHSVRVGGVAADAALAAQLRFRVGGPSGARTVTAASPAAEQALQGGSGDRFSRLAAGMADFLDAQGYPAELHGVNFMTSFGGGAVAETVAAQEARLRGDPAQLRKAVPAGSNPALARRFGARVGREARALAAMDGRGLAFHQDGWINVMPQITASISDAGGGLGVDLATSTRLVDVLTHELQHATNPQRTGPRDHWLEEGRAQYLAQFPGVAADLARRTGLDYDPNMSGTYYPAETSAITTLLDAAGVPTGSAPGLPYLHQDRVDATSNAALHATRELLDDPHSGDTAGALAAAIGARVHLSSRATEQLHARIMDTHASAPRIEALLHDVSRTE